jgi:hypothetical protein
MATGDESIGACCFRSHAALARLLPWRRRQGLLQLPSGQAELNCHYSLL